VFDSIQLGIKDYKIPGTNIEVKADDMISIAGSGIQARKASKIKKCIINLVIDYLQYLGNQMKSVCVHHCFLKGPAHQIRCV
jgi:hypothetical protein